MKKEVSGSTCPFFMPYGKFMFCWNFLLLLLMLLSVTETIYQIVNGSDFMESVEYIRIIRLATDMSVVMDIVFNFRTGYIDSRDISRVIAIGKMMMLHYVRSWFIIDLLATDILAYVLMWIVDGSRWFRVLRLVKLIRVFKVLRSAKIITKSIGYMRSDPSFAIVTDPAQLEMAAV